jgi:hypothetical protein
MKTDNETLLTAILGCGSEVLKDLDKIRCTIAELQESDTDNYINIDNYAQIAKKLKHYSEIFELKSKAIEFKLWLDRQEKGD